MVSGLDVYGSSYSESLESWKTSMVEGLVLSTRLHVANRHLRPMPTHFPSIDHSELRHDQIHPPYPRSTHLSPRFLDNLPEAALQKPHYC